MGPKNSKSNASFPHHHSTPQSRTIERFRPASWPVAGRTASFLALPMEIRQIIYEQVLVIRHPVYLFQAGGKRVETFAPGRPKHWLALLHTDRQVSDEAKAVVYKMNHFLFVDTAQKQVQLLQSFLDLIGPVNADLLSNVDINLPAAVSMGHQPGAVKLEEDELRTIRILRKNCGRLTTLGLRIQRNNSRFITGTDGDSAQSTREALRQIHAQLQAIPSLVTINARVTIKDLSSAAMDAMQSLGWNVLFD